MDGAFAAGGWWAYALVVLAAATPVVEVIVVIPTAIIAGLAPVPTTILALAGNASTVAVAVVAGDRVLAWWRQRRRGDDPQERGEQATQAGRSARARRLAQRWGVPGLAFIAPVTTGTHIAALAGLATGASRGAVLRWMIAGLAVWAAAAAAAAVLGVEAFRS